MREELLFSRQGFVPTGSDTTDNITQNFAFLWVGSTGNVKVRTAGGDDVTFLAVPAGTLLGGSVPIAIKRVWTTGTTATIANMLVIHCGI